jgi:TPR repeat protein
VDSSPAQDLESLDLFSNSDQINADDDLQSVDSVMAQMILGYKYLHGLGVRERCSTSALYYEEAAL